MKVVRGEEDIVNNVEVTDEAVSEDNARKLSYEELKNINNQLLSQRNEIYQAYVQAQSEHFTNRLAFLFDILKIGNYKFEPEFLDMCYQEVKNVMFPDKNKEVEE